MVSSMKYICYAWLLSTLVPYYYVLELLVFNFMFLWNGLAFFLFCSIGLNLNRGVIALGAPHESKTGIT